MRCKIPERDLAQRLDNTFCRYNNKPYYIRTEAPIVHLLDICTKRVVLNIDPSDPGFDISTIPLGYMQFHPDVVAYASRAPMRIFKQGVSIDNLEFRYLDEGNRVRPNVFSKAFVDMIEGNYPSFDMCLEVAQTSKTPKQVAVSRDIAFNNNDGNSIVVVYFKNRQVGWIPPNQKVVIVPSSDYAWIVSKYLSELKWEVR